MASRRLGIGLAVGVALALAGPPLWAGEQPAPGGGALHLTADQKDLLWLEPVLVIVRVDSPHVAGVPAVPGAGKQGSLRFEIEPAVKVRAGAKPLPLEAQTAGAAVQARVFDLFEWFTFPDGGTWTVRAVLEQGGTKLASQPLTLTIRKPAKGTAEFDPVARIHHTPWSNYETNAFCGDTFDLVQKWPASRLAPYCHYWNGRHLQNKKDLDKAIASYRIVVEKYPDFALADHAEYGIIECLTAQKQLLAAQKRSVALREKLEGRAARAGVKPGTAVFRLANDAAHRLNDNLGLK
jgi:hypothetical protein